MKSDQRSAVSDQPSECACFEYVGDNPHCPVHGKAEAQTSKGAKAPEVSGEQMLVVRRSSSAGKVIVTLGNEEAVSH